MNAAPWTAGPGELRGDMDDETLLCIECCEPVEDCLCCLCEEWDEEDEADQRFDAEREER